MVYFAKTRDPKMYLGASQDLRLMAKNLRNHQTDSEKKLWEFLRNKKFKGLKFRRQHAILNYIADFYCVQYQLVIEVDGGIHNRPDIIQKDNNRTIELQRSGIKVLRFTDDQIMDNIESVLTEIENYITNHCI
jgi:very-short-patch-repair endonuclease